MSMSLCPCLVQFLPSVSYAKPKASAHFQIPSRPIFFFLSILSQLTNFSFSLRWYRCVTSWLSNSARHPRPRQFAPSSFSILFDAPFFVTYFLIISVPGSNLIRTSTVKNNSRQTGFAVFLFCHSRNSNTSTLSCPTGSTTPAIICKVTRHTSRGHFRLTGVSVSLFWNLWILENRHRIHPRRLVELALGPISFLVGSWSCPPPTRIPTTQLP